MLHIMRINNYICISLVFTPLKTDLPYHMYVNNEFLETNVVCGKALKQGLDIRVSVPLTFMVESY